jgi:hypothetical protein
MTDTMIITLVCSFFVTWIGLPVIYILLSKEKHNITAGAKEVKQRRWVQFFIVRPIIAGTFSVLLRRGQRPPASRDWKKARTGLPPSTAGQLGGLLECSLRPAHWLVRRAKRYEDHAPELEPALPSCELPAIYQRLVPKIIHQKEE